jgi:hypothetical protein
LSRRAGPGVTSLQADFSAATGRYREVVPESVFLDVPDGTTVSCSGLPAVLGAAVVAVEPLRHAQRNAAVAGIWRGRGTASSSVLKLATPPAPETASAAWPTSDEPAHWNYWRRETLAYSSQLAATAYGDAITAPVLLEANPRPDGGVELWLADVSGAGGFDWPVPRLARFAYELGAGQARWAGRVPDTAWLSRRWLAQYLAEGPSRFVRVDDADWDHPSVAAAWPAAVRRQLRRLWAGRRRVLAAAEAAERTLCHLDVWPANLIDHAGTSVLLDWAFTGDGAVGEDVANLIVDSCADGLMDAALLPEIAESTTGRYLEGLRDGGWSGSDDAVRSAIAACGAAKYSWLGPARLASAVRDELGPSSYGQDTSAVARMQRLSGVVVLIAGWAASALG